MNNMPAYGVEVRVDHVNERLAARETALGEGAADVE